MSFGDLIRTVLEIAVVLFTIWGLFHEDRFIAFEEKLFSNIRRRKLRVVKSAKPDNISLTFSRQ